MTCDRAALTSLPAFNAERDCPVDRAMALMESASKNTCGKCVFCREGTLQVYEILRDITGGCASDGDEDLLTELCGVIAVSASCGQARWAACQCLELMAAYPEAFRQHITRNRCQNLVCRQLYTLHVLPSNCTGCGECIAICKDGAIRGGENMIHVIDNDSCSRCLVCVEGCTANAIQKAGAVKPKCPDAPIPVGSFGEPGSRRRRRG